jgi:two-component system chemotaxis response regulator CheY
MNERILIVDDSAAMRGLLKFTLSGAGYQCLEATDGNGALRVLHDSPVDLIITDLWMEGMDGAHLTAAVKADSDLRHIPVLALTTDPSADRHAELRRCGALGVLEKKIAPNELLATVQRALAVA